MTFGGTQGQEAFPKHSELQMLYFECVDIDIDVEIVVRRRVLKSTRDCDRVALCHDSTKRVNNVSRYKGAFGESRIAPRLAGSASQ
jgi:hypothetical protein